MKIHFIVVALLLTLLLSFSSNASSYVTNMPPSSFQSSSSSSTSSFSLSHRLRKFLSAQNTIRSIESQHDIQLLCNQFNEYRRFDYERKKSTCSLPSTIFNRLNELKPHHSLYKKYCQALKTVEQFRREEEAHTATRSSGGGGGDNVVNHSTMTDCVIVPRPPGVLRIGANNTTSSRHSIPRSTESVESRSATQAQVASLVNTIMEHRRDNEPSDADISEQDAASSQHQQRKRKRSTLHVGANVAVGVVLSQNGSFGSGTSASNAHSSLSQSSSIMEANVPRHLNVCFSGLESSSGSNMDESASNSNSSTIGDHISRRQVFGGPSSTLVADTMTQIRLAANSCHRDIEMTDINEDNDDVSTNDIFSSVNSSLTSVHGLSQVSVGDGAMRRTSVQHDDNDMAANHTTPTADFHPTFEESCGFLAQGVMPPKALHENKETKINQAKFCKLINRNCCSGSQTNFVHCIECKERFFDTKRSSKSVNTPNGRRYKCIRCVNAGSENKYNETNQMNPWPKMDHLKLPVLSDIEEMMIARVHPYMKCFRLEGGGTAYKGQILNVEQDVTSVANTTLPLLPSEVPFFIVRKPHASAPVGYRDFRINKNNIKVWLRFLAQNSKYYNDIDLQQVDERLDSIQLDDETGSVCSQIRYIEESEVTALSQQQGEGPDNHEIHEDDIEVNTIELGPETGNASGEMVSNSIQEEVVNLPVTNEMVQTQAIRQLQLIHPRARPPPDDPLTVHWPALGRFVNDFDCPGLFAKAFPTLFPYGVGDPSIGDIPIPVSEDEVGKHLTKYAVNLYDAQRDLKAHPAYTMFSDEVKERIESLYSERSPMFMFPFVKHNRFIHFMQNTVERHRSFKQRGFWLNRSSEYATMTTEQIGHVINRGGEPLRKLLGSMQCYNANINGSPQYLYRKRKLLENLIEQQGLCTMWFTLSMADNHWSDLFRLLNKDSNGNPRPLPRFDTEQEEASWKRKLVRDNPHVVDAYFKERVHALFETMFGDKGIELDWLWFRIEYQCRGSPHGHGCCKIKNAPNLSKLSQEVLKGRIAYQILIENGVEHELEPEHRFECIDDKIIGWQEYCRDKMDLKMTNLSVQDIVDLKATIRLGRKAEEIIVAWHDFLLTTSNLDPPIDATADTRDASTFFDPTTCPEKHPSAVDPSRILNIPAELESQYCKSCNVQSRHKHQAYCDRNHKKREAAKIAFRNNVPNAVDPNSIPIDCRFRYNKPIRNETRVMIDLTKSRNSFTKRMRLVTKRNDGWMNSHMRAVMEIWSANMDWQLVIDLGMVIDYMTKYVTKSDLMSNKAVAPLMKRLLRDTCVTAGRSVASFLRKVMSKLLGERIMSKQESCHLMLGIPIVHCSHEMISVDLENKSLFVQIDSTINANDNNTNDDANDIANDNNTNEDANDITNNDVNVIANNNANDTANDNANDTANDDANDAANDNANDNTNDDANSTKVRMSLIDCYAVRTNVENWSCDAEYRKHQASLESMTLWKFCQSFKVGTKGNSENFNKIILNKKDVVVDFYPKLSSSPSSTEYVQYCKYELMKHQPWIDDASNAWNNEENEDEIKNLFSHFLNSFGDDPPNFLRVAIQAHEADRTGDDHSDVQVERNEEASFFSHENPPPEEDALLVEDFITGELEELVDEDFEWDQNHDWSQHRLSNEELPSSETLKSNLDRFVKNQEIDRGRNIERPHVAYDDLNNEQKLAHDMVIRACYDKCSNGRSRTDHHDGHGISRLQIVLGAGGTGKSHTINAIISTLTNNEGQFQWTDDHYAIHATTGKAASNIGGTTIHNYRDGLGFFGRQFKELSDRMLGIMQPKWINKKLLILDEFSMLAQRELHFIDQRLRQLTGKNLPFGGLIIVLVGDPAQLPPVQAKCLWDKKSGLNSNDGHGHTLYRFFDAVIKLRVNNRLDRNDPDAIRFDGILQRLRNGHNTRDDWEYLRHKGSRHSVSATRWEQFNGNEVIHIFNTNEQVNKRNLQCLKELNTPVVRINAFHTGRCRQASSNEVGLDSTLFLAEGAFILLTKNIFQSAGLCNGATGNVVAIVYNDNTPPPGLPDYIIIDFGNQYTGPQFFGEAEERSGWVPIFPQTSDWQNSSSDELTTNSRTMFPLRLSYAWTPWKIQGQTIRNKVVVNLGPKENDHGLTYTAFSRVTRADDLGIDGGFSFKRFTDMVKGHSKMSPRIEEEKRLDDRERETMRYLRQNNLM